MTNESIAAESVSNMTGQKQREEVQRLIDQVEMLTMTQKGLPAALDKALRRNQELTSDLEQPRQSFHELLRLCDDKKATYDDLATENVELHQLQRETAAYLERHNNEYRDLMDLYQQHAEANKEWQAGWDAWQRGFNTQEHLCQHSTSMGGFA